MRFGVVLDPATRGKGQGGEEGAKKDFDFFFVFFWGGGGDFH